jgi:CheY-like chemotaxis protein
MPPPPEGPATFSLLPRRDQATAVLVVDDDDAIRQALVRLLEDEGYAVRQARDGVEAVGILYAAEAPLVVLLDWLIPKIDGLTILQTVQHDPQRLGHHAYIFMSAAFPAGLREVAALPETLHVSVLIKPFTIALVLEKVERAAASLAPGLVERRSDDEDGEGGDDNDRATDRRTG